MKRLSLLLAAFALFIGACGDEADDTQPPATATPTTTASQTSAPAGPSVIVSSSPLGDILTDQDGNTLYLFVPDEQGPSVCNGDCAEAWPPLLDAAAGDGVDAALLGTAARDDGTQQVTYNGWPLYYFAADASPGDVNGQGVNDIWFVLDAAGNGVGMP